MFEPSSTGKPALFVASSSAAELGARYRCGCFSPPERTHIKCPTHGEPLVVVWPKGMKERLQERARQKNGQRIDTNDKIIPITPSDYPSRESPLSNREIEVARLIFAGKSDAAIAAALDISTHTVRSHIAMMARKLAGEKYSGPYGRKPRSRIYRWYRSAMLGGESADIVPRSFVYFIQADGCGNTKIGMAIDPYARLEEIRSCSPLPLELRGFLPGAREVERAFHQQFSVHRLHGEWFAPGPELSQFMDATFGPSPVPQSTAA